MVMYTAEASVAAKEYGKWLLKINFKALVQFFIRV